MLIGALPSLPARERGSKLCRPPSAIGCAGRSPRGSADRNTAADVEIGDPLRSLPARERGSKHQVDRQESCRLAGRSPRGSADRNRSIPMQSLRRPSRSPRGSADRNNSRARSVISVRSRSPRGSADRNSAICWGYPPATGSLPARERGSKLVLGDGQPASPCVAPRAGARIETTMGCLDRIRLGARRSPRGSADRNNRGFEPAPDVTEVAPRAGARIETGGALRWLRCIVAPRAGARIETADRRIDGCGQRVAPRAGARIETSECGHNNNANRGRSPRGSADRNGARPSRLRPA